MRLRGSKTLGSAIAPWFLILGAMGCGSSRAIWQRPSVIGTTVQSTNSPQGSNPELSLSTSSVAFGAVLLGSVASRQVYFSNKGTAPLIVASASTSGPGIAASELSLPLTLAPGQSSSFQVVFAPSSSGSVSGSVNMQEANGSNVQLEVSGTGVMPLPHRAVLSWQYNNPAGISGYNVYRGGQSGGPYTRIASLTSSTMEYSDTTVASGQTYYYVVTAFNTSAESPRSGEVVAQIPFP